MTDPQIDRLELTMPIEDQFTGLEISDGGVDQIEVVGDLLRYIENTDEVKV
jgi:acyl carrier protein